MIKRTIHGMNPFDCISSMQKFIRRGMEAEAMEMACEMAHTGKGFATWVCNRLRIISHEDIGLACPNVILLVDTICNQAKEVYKPEFPDVWRLFVGNAIRALCRAPKSREADHFQAAVGLRNSVEGHVPEVPEWTCDHHTRKGKQLGRGLDYFREVSTKLEPPANKDPYEDEAFRLWELQASLPKEKAEDKPKSQDGVSHSEAKKLF